MLFRSISAIVGGIVTAIFGGSRLGVSGPALALTILIARCVSEHGISGLLIIGFICGILQIICGVFRLGRYTKLIPIPVIWAFTAAIGVTLVISVIPSLLQIQAPDLSHIINVVRDIDGSITHMNPMAFVLGLISIFIAQFSSKYFPRIPNLLFAVAIPTIIVYIFQIKNLQFLSIQSLSLNSAIFTSFSTIHNWHSILISALAVFVLATLETILSAHALDNFGEMEPHHPNQELIGQGIANMVVAIFGGIPITQLLTRSQINVENGAKTRRAAIFHSLFILLTVTLVPQLLVITPIPVLAGVLISAAISMINFAKAREYWYKDKFDFLIYAVTFLMLVFTSLVNGIQTGIIVALVIMVIRMVAVKSNVRIWDNQQVMRISISGNVTLLSFADIDNLKSSALSHPRLKFVIFDMDKLNSIDKAGAQYLLSAIGELEQNQIQIILHGLNREQYLSLKSLNTKGYKFSNTVSESEVKQLLESSGVKHSVNEVLKQGMAEFHEEYSQRSKLMSTLAKEQKPHTLLITCSDSRLNPNQFFSVGLGELFVIRNVGNVVPPYDKSELYSEVAAIEYALEALQIRNIVICAHTECGAVKASLKRDEKTNLLGLDNWLQIIKDGFALNWPPDAAEGTKINVLHQVENLKSYPMVGVLIEKQEITISAWVYDVHSAHMLEWSQAQAQFIQIIQATHK